LVRSVVERSIFSGKKASLRRSLVGAAAIIGFVLPSTGFAIGGIGSSNGAENAPAFDVFTPASVDPQLAARVAEKARDRGIRFTPAGAGAIRSERTVTVAVRIDDDAAQAITTRSAVETIPGTGIGITGLRSSRFDLGTARGYRSFARPQAATAPAPLSATARIAMPDSVSKLSVPDLSEFKPSRPNAADKPGRLQPRIELEDERIAGRSPNTLDSLGQQSVELGGSFRVSRNLDVTAGVRYSQERDRLDPVANSVKDSQAVYVGTQIKF